MIGRFFLIWFLITAVAFAWAWIAKSEEKKVARFWLKRAGLSAAIALLIIGAALTLNNISGV